MHNEILFCLIQFFFFSLPLSIYLFKKKTLSVKSQRKLNIQATPSPLCVAHCLVQKMAVGMLKWGNGVTLLEHVETLV